MRCSKAYRNVSSDARKDYSDHPHESVHLRYWPRDKNFWPVAKNALNRESIRALREILPA
jgi:hypothetical protein